MRAVVYTRVSTEKQVDGTSLETQKAICRALIADREGWVLVDEFEDAGISGADSTRPEWNRLLRGAAAGDFDAVFVYDLDRWSRDMNDGMRAIRQLENVGVALHDSKNPTVNAASDEAFLGTGVGMLVSEQYKRQMVKRTAAGQRAAAAMGRWPGGQPSFGWKLDGFKREARAVPDEREREIIQTVYVQIVKRRMTAGEVAAYLNDTGRHPRGGSSRMGSGMRWEHATIRQVFGHHALHDGLYTWGKPDGRRKSRRSHHTKMNPKTGLPYYGEGATVQMPEPPLTKSQWDALQRGLHRRSAPANMKAPETQLLGNRVTGRCGKHYNGVSLDGGSRAAYRCSGRRYKSKGDALRCTCSQFDAKWIDPIVWGEIVGLLSTPERLQAAAREWHGLQEDDSEDYATAHVRGLDEQIARLERAVSRLTDDVLFADDPEKQRERLAGLKSELATLREQRATAELLRSDRQATARALLSLADIAERMQGRLASMPLSAKRRIVELLGVEVQVVAWESHGNGEHPVEVVITGRLDPRLFADGEGLERTAVHPTPDAGNTTGTTRPGAVLHTGSGEGFAPSPGVSTPHAAHTTAGDRWCRWCS